jgi:pilus assembly protein CpaB
VYRIVTRQLKNGSGQAANLVVAAQDLEIGHLIKKEDLKMASFVGAPPKDAILKADAAVGRAVLTPVYAGEPIAEKRLAPVGSGGGLAATIPEGMRACAVKVNEVVGVAGFVLPGMRVDVLITGNPARATDGGTRVRTVLQNIVVLSAGKNFQRDTDGKPVEVPVVNLLVTPEQAEILSLASNEAHIQLVLRNPIDHQLAKPPGTELARLFGEELPKPAPPPVHLISAPAPPRVVERAKPVPPPSFVVQVINGSKQTQQTFPVPGGGN